MPNKRRAFNDFGPALDVLYASYVQASQQTIANILETTSAGPLRNRLLAMHRTLNRELFEARLQSLARHPGQLAAVVQSLCPAA